ILIKNQELIDNVTNRIDKVSILFSVLITLQNINLQSFEYLIDNYKIPDEQKNRILKTLKNEIKF
ncbi:MAG: hypothetical protein LBC61_00605, partial [Candidatus Peribacteria bacterium]|nr:hypothetical protein [Candidatus Peribacteria bacterium]